MQQIHDEYRGLSLMVDLNWDWVLWCVAIGAALGTLAWLLPA